MKASVFTIAKLDLTTDINVIWHCKIGSPIYRDSRFLVIKVTTYSNADKDCNLAPAEA